ncbi:MAG: low affinity iron permease family protein [Rhodanobacter sp.]|nr:MAG: low affinity iron permease family protein [Rhodanobacter sp.]
MVRITQSFRRLAESTASYSGKPVAFLIAACIVVVWGATGPLFHYGDSWQLVINTGTTIVTFLMVFLIQNSQNRHTAALQIKLDELIRVTEASNGLLDLEDMDEEVLERVRENYRKLARQRQEKASRALRGGGGAAATVAEAEEARRHVEEIDRELDECRSARDAESAGKDEVQPSVAV